MALMSYRESNHVVRFGVRPAHDGEQITKSAIAQNVTTVIHTVTAGKVLYLCFARLNAYWSVVGNAHPFQVRNVANAVQYTILDMQAPATGHGELTGSFWPPIEIPEGWDIALYSGNVGDILGGFIFGWEE